MDGIKAGLLKLKEITQDVKVFRFEDQYTLVGIAKVGCRDKSKIVDAVLDEVYKHGDEFNLTILLLTRDSFEKIKDSLGEDITERVLAGSEEVL
ncbi:hypothetical protein [Metallosphaera hakonensis]|uniref:GGDEF domain-containing protein n=1 Tax=Metallosphaera hakonensis JCM 8857 = DSM 7519 TaxID=1293036 RepID=A0A2U9ISW0_9CREN|nr:hypothetical protein [Metallosphaera hakonensis]AWR99151.1 hypothetical protein DFR87_04930 [Metallosphaera hakonensis JCM 8857 = DSM 7519]